MATPASVAKHPIHPMLIAFPIGLWVFSLVCDFIFLATGSEGAVTVSFYSMVGGLVGAVAAAIPGFMDLLAIKQAEVKKLGFMHMTVNLSVMVLYGLNLWARSHEPPTMTEPIILSIIGVGLLAVSGWLGGEMVHVHGVGVEPHATSPTDPEPSPPPGEPARRGY